MTPDPSDRVIRYNFTERALHAIIGLVFLYLLLTGLAFWTPGLYWIATVLGGGFVSRLLHPWMGFVFAALAMWMFVLWHRDMETTDADRAWRRAMAQYVRNEDAHVPAVGRFNYGQKIFFWVMLWSMLALLLSGVVLWIPDAVQGGARWLSQAAILVHAVSALVAIGAFIVHVYMGIAVVPGSVNAIVHGGVSRDWARHHHRLWADELAETAAVAERADPPR
jgi:formate dehydrogenase subunit gamma